MGTKSTEQGEREGGGLVFYGTGIKIEVFYVSLNY